MAEFGESSAGSNIRRALDISVEPFPLEAAQAEFNDTVDRASDVAEQCPGFADQLAKLNRAGRQREVRRGVGRPEVTDNARRAVDALFDQQRRAAFGPPA